MTIPIDEAVSMKGTGEETHSLIGQKPSDINSACSSLSASVIS